MALMPCQECGRSVSDQALSCPHCGFPLKEDPVLDYDERKVRIGFWWSWILLGIGGLLTLGSFAIPELRSFAAGVLVIGLLSFAINLMRDYLIGKAKVRPDNRPRRGR
ncbi:MAG: zinc-ribbon domain-containing protein [Candidatus Hydrogenedentes bacterium]|nr:zinc-ribbon domain-containing protein [Candidatus Hydrogenedentota bacterium]